MELTPQLLAEVEFRDTLRGYDRDEVDTFLEQVGVAIAQLQGRLGETIARAEVAEARGAGESGDGVSTDTITRTLLLAQRTADATVAEAEADAAQMMEEAREQATRLRAEAEADRAAVVAETENEARQVAEEARRDLLSELQQLQADRDRALVGVEQLRAALDGERGRLIEAAAHLTELADSDTLDAEPLSDVLDDAADELVTASAQANPGDESAPAPDDDRDVEDIDQSPPIQADDEADDEPDEIDLSERTGPYDIEADEPDVDLSEADEPVESGGAPVDPAPGSSVFDGLGTGPATQAVDVLALDTDAEGDDVFVQQLRQAVSSDGEHEGETMAEFFESDDSPKRLFGRSSD